MTGPQFPRSPRARSTASPTGRKTSALDTAERQRRYKARMREMGMSEVRGIYAPRALHRQIRAAAREMVSACESLRER